MRAREDVYMVVAEQAPDVGGGATRGLARAVARSAMGCPVMRPAVFALTLDPQTTMTALSC